MRLSSCMSSPRTMTPHRACSTVFMVVRSSSPFRQMLSVVFSWPAMNSESSSVGKSFSSWKMELNSLCDMYLLFGFFSSSICFWLMVGSSIRTPLLPFPMGGLKMTGFFGYSSSSSAELNSSRVVTSL